MLFGLDHQRCRQEILSRIGFLPSETMFYRRMRVKELLRFSAGLRRQDCDEEARVLCDHLKLDVSRRIDELSLGNRKKAGIVCALQHRPELYILDEPTSGLDPLIQHEVFALLKERCEAGATVFLSSHVLSEIQRHCSRAAIIREGRLIASGEVADLSRTSARRVSIRSRADLSRLDGVRGLEKSQDGLTFLYSGDIHALMQAKLSDVSISEPDLEEIFMHYYAEGSVEK